MRILFLSVIASFIAFNAFAEELSRPTKEGIARLRVCNQKAHSYCQNTATYGIGFGVIKFVGFKRSYPVRPWGRTDVAHAIMLGKLDAFITLENRKHLNNKFYSTDKFWAKGFLGKDPVQPGKTVFFLEEFEDSDVE